MEFAEVREYFPGDDVRAIDWNVTARMGHPFVKLYQEERELTVLFLVDRSGSGRFGTRRRMKAELAAEVGAILALSASQNNDKVGLVAFSDDVELYVPPAKGRRHVLRVVREILYFEPRGHGTDLSRALDHLSRAQRRKAVVFILSDFLDEGYERALRTAARTHDVVALRLRDAREETLPAVGLVGMTDLETGREFLVDTSDGGVRRAFARKVQETDARFQAAVRRAQVDHVDLWTDQDAVNALVGLFRERQRRRARR
jgi:uncharacterized protein (DUF58 family)